jgi:anthranilate synthase component 1
MSPAPAFDLFGKRYETGKSQLVSARLAADMETPVSAFLKLAGEDVNSFLLESVEGGEQLGRYSIIGVKPDVIWRCSGAKSEINLSADKSATSFAAQDGAPLTNLKRLFAQSEIDVIDDDLPPMAAGVFGYLSYDMARQMEALGPRPNGGVDTPDSVFIRPTLLAVFDNVRQEILLITPVRPTQTVNADQAYAAACDRLDAAAAKLAAHLSEDLRNPKVGAPPPAPDSNVASQQFKGTVNRAKEYIAAGDIFQVVLSQRFTTRFEAPPFSLYRSLRRTNPSPFMFYLNFEGFSLVGSSPEILVRVRDGEVAIRPIAGTRWRGKTPAEDKALEEDLLADPKERAEHLMLLDLGRNDVGRSAEIGSVRVTESFAIERYSHVMHIVSNVVGKLREDVHPVDAVSAGFPAGTVTGAPKIRAMEIIDELEACARGVYGGAIGYFSADGNVDTCIALRTAIIKDGELHVQAGAGVVADSNAEYEHTECVNKAKALFAAAQAVFK